MLKKYHVAILSKEKFVPNKQDVGSTTVLPGEAIEESLLNEYETWETEAPTREEVLESKRDKWKDVVVHGDVREFTITMPTDVEVRVREGGRPFLG
jgi:RIO-like serine/threonine protein kinase